MYPYSNVRVSGFQGPMDFNSYRASSDMNMNMNNFPMMGDYPMNMGENDERFFWAPFVVGGLAGTALGFGIANNNQINNGNNNGPVFVPGPAPYYPYPTYVYPGPTYYF